MIAFLLLETADAACSMALGSRAFNLFFEAGPDPDVPDYWIWGGRTVIYSIVQVLSC